MEHEKAGLALYDKLFEHGDEFNLKPGCPNLIERIESSLLSYGNDIDIGDNPLECGFDKYVNLDTNVEFLGKEELKKVKADGIKRKLMGVKIDADQIAVNSSINMYDKTKNLIGELRSGTYNPSFKQVIWIAMINEPYFKDSQEIVININGKDCTGKLCDLPFI